MYFIYLFLDFFYYIWKLCKTKMFNVSYVYSLKQILHVHDKKLQITDCPGRQNIQQ